MRDCLVTGEAGGYHGTHHSPDSEGNRSISVQIADFKCVCGGGGGGGGGPGIFPPRIWLCKTPYMCAIPSPLPPHKILYKSLVYPKERIISPLML